MLFLFLFLKTAIKKACYKHITLDYHPHDNTHCKRKFIKLVWNVVVSFLFLFFLMQRYPNFATHSCVRDEQVRHVPKHMLCDLEPMRLVVVCKGQTSHVSLP